jgi:hypothetical protein
LINPSRRCGSVPGYTTDHRPPDQSERGLVPECPDAEDDRWREVARVGSGIHHGDHHDVWFDPTNPKRMITGQ